MTSAPEGLTSLEYARHLLEEVLGWPAKGNLELMADCITAISKSKKLPLHKGHGYMERAIRLAREQGQEVNRLWLMDGAYMNVRPKTSLVPIHKPMSPEERERLRRYQESPEYKEDMAKIDQLLKQISQGKGM